MASASRPRTPAGRARAACRALASAYPGRCALVHDGPLQLLVATVLSAQTTDERVNQVTPGLFARFPSARDLARADVIELEALIRPTGFFRVKARTLVALGLALEQRHQGAVPRHMAELTRLPGVGRKTANVVLGVGFGIPGLAVDTHVIRLTNLLGVVATRDPVAIEQQVCAMLPRSQWTRVGLRLIEHGRRVCIANRPRCSACLLVAWCPGSPLARGRRATSGRLPA
ncbi:MAG TPA: endonuclease III [Verrucomicrobiae bacterium]|nr:endonuclease III [Verrucomicrobiae bacterium]